SLPALTAQRPVLPSDAWGLTFWDRGKCRDLIASLRNEGIFTPPDTRGTLLSPGYIGGVNWGGMAFDEQRQRVIAAVNHLPMVVTLMSRQELDRDRRRAGVRERGDGQLPARLRHRDRTRAVEVQAAGGGAGHAHDLSRRTRPAPVSRHQRRRPRRPRHAARRLPDRLRAPGRRSG